MNWNHNNCAVQALAAITGEEPAAIVAAISAIPDENGGPAFVGGGVKEYSLGTYLERLGWTPLYREDCPALPWTCVILVPGHAFALVGGRLLDPARRVDIDEPILTVWVPPARDRG